MLPLKVLCIVQLAVIFYGISTQAHPILSSSKYSEDLATSLEDDYEPNADVEEGFCSGLGDVETLKAEDNAIGFKNAILPTGCGSYQPSWTVSQMMRLKAALALPKDLQPIHHHVPEMAP